tara:strand:+ start:5057 stop:5314 length:258 start_codon:yes stop_codon:yes gene_type:complete
MKTIIDNATRTSRYLLDDEKSVFFDENKIIVASDFTITDLNVYNASLVAEVTAPDDWFGGKYTCASDGTFTEVEGWVDPREEEVE